MLTRQLTVHPVVEGRGSLGELEVEFIHGHHDLLGLLQSRSALRRQGAQPVPLLADLGAARVHLAHVLVVEGVELLGDGGDLLHSEEGRG